MDPASRHYSIGVGAPLTLELDDFRSALQIVLCPVAVLVELELDGVSAADAPPESGPDALGAFPPYSAAMVATASGPPLVDAVHPSVAALLTSWRGVSAPVDARGLDVHHCAAWVIVRLNDTLSLPKLQAEDLSGSKAQ